MQLIMSGSGQISTNHVAPCTEFRVLNMCQEVVSFFFLKKSAYMWGAELAVSPRGWALIIKPPLRDSLED